VDPLHGVLFDTCAVVGSAGLLLIRVRPRLRASPTNGLVYDVRAVYRIHRGLCRSCTARPSLVRGL
jgi:hypothetical protein